MTSPYSSRKRKPLQQTSATSYRRSLVWQWLHDGIRANSDPVGDVIRILRQRIDMPRSFPTRTYMRQYLERAGLDADTVGHVIDRMWTLYREWEAHVRSNPGPTT